VERLDTTCYAKSSHFLALELFKDKHGHLNILKEFKGKFSPFCLAMCNFPRKMSNSNKLKLKWQRPDKIMHSGENIISNVSRGIFFFKYIISTVPFRGWSEFKI